MPTKILLWIDCIGALLAGAAVLSLSSWLAGLYGLSLSFVTFLGLANIAFGAYSLKLAMPRRRRRPWPRPLALVSFLAGANVAWGFFCFAAAVRLAGKASPFGLAQLILEGLYVGGLGALEWRSRRQLAAAIS